MAYVQRSKVNSEQHARRRALAQKVLNAAVSGTFNFATYQKLVAEYGSAAVSRLIGRLPEKSALRARLHELRHRARGEFQTQAPHFDNATDDAGELPPDFEAAVAAWAKHSRVIHDTHIERGGDYTAYTVRRRVTDAHKFCAFVASQGVRYWSEVSQRHLDLYIADRSHNAGQHAYTFLQFVRGKFRLAHRFIRPTNRSPSAVERLLSVDEQIRVGRAAASHPDAEAALAALLLTLYAQTLKDTTSIRLNQLMKTDKGLFIKFAETWLPLDDSTARRIEEVARWNELTLPQSEHFDGIEYPRLFSATPQAIYHRVAAITQCSMKSLRLSAIANVIRSGYTSRGSISRALGVSMVTVRYIERAFPWDLQSSLPEEVVKQRNEFLEGGTDT